MREQLFGRWQTGVADSAVHEYVASMGAYGCDMWSRAGREISGALAAHEAPLAALPPLAEVQGVACPTLHLYAQPGDDGYPAAQQAFAAEHPWFQVHRLGATSHFPCLEAPDEVAARIGEFARQLR